jgi:YVTN family beta-propeller protein
MSETFNTATPHVVATVPVGTEPTAVAVDGHEQVFVTNAGDNTVSVVNSGTNATTATISVGLHPEGAATDPQFGICVANGGDNTVSLIDRSHTVVTTLGVGDPSGPPPNMVRVAVDHFAGRAYVTNRGGQRVSIVRFSDDPPVIAPEFMDVPASLGVAIDAVDHRVYVTQPDFNTVSVVDPATTGVIATIPVGQQPVGIAIDSPRRLVYVANSGSNAVSVIDIATGGGVVDIDVAAQPIGVAVDSRGDAYVSHSDGTVKVIGAGSNSVRATIPVGSKPQGLAFQPHSNRVYVANSGDGTLSAIDLGDG